LVSTFSFLKHVPKKIIFDNLKPAVKRVLTGKERILQEAFLKFQSFYCFESGFCGPGKGNEKGMVENLVKYVENNI
jgi:transposase